MISMQSAAAETINGQAGNARALLGTHQATADGCCILHQTLRASLICTMHMHVWRQCEIGQLHSAYAMCDTEVHCDRPWHPTPYKLCYFMTL